MSDDQRINDIRGDIRQLFEIVSKTQQAIVRVETKLDTTPKCPDPGACTRVERACVEQNRRLAVLETAENKRTGAFVAVGLVCSGLTAMATLFVEWLRK